MEDVLKRAQENSSKATKGKEDYAQMVFNVIDGAIIRASQYKDVTGIFLAQVVASSVFQVMYRETNSPLDREYDFTHGSDIDLISIDDNFLTIDEIIDHYARLGFLAGVKVFVFKDSIQYRILISWSDEEETDNKVNIHKYVDGVDIFANDSHPEAY
jgi:hypothetical protein